MKYSEIRDQIKDGDILAWKVKGKWLESFYSFKINLVSLFQRDPFIHVGFAINEDERVLVMESVTPLVRKVPLSGELPCYVISGKGLTEKQRVKAMALLGKARYSIWEAILAFFNRSDMTNDRWDCDEFVRYALDIRCDGSPAKLIEFMLNNGSTLTKVTAE